MHEEAERTLIKVLDLCEPILSMKSSEEGGKMID